MPVAVQAPVTPTFHDYRDNLNLKATTAKPLQAAVEEGKVYGDFRDALARDGFVVVPGVLSKEKAESYVSRCYDWLESFELGFDRNDRSTYDLKKLPFSHRGGLYNRYGSAHEQVAWDIRQEPGLVAPFEKIWGTDDLLVSFDGMNISVPLDFKSNGLDKPWAHVDQSPVRTWMHCIQGICNLAPNGPDDGGLMVLKGSKPLYTEIFETFKGTSAEPEDGWSLKDSYHFTPEMLQWFYDRGCEWHKIEAGPGDLILWDSRTCHYGSVPKGDNARVATYVCYKPRSMCPPEILEIKKQTFKEMKNTSHDPCSFLIHSPTSPQYLADGVTIDKSWEGRSTPKQPPVLTERGLKLAGF